jgi:two-component system, chemotaxis family, sensor histidine kinase and response regulator WspE
VLQWKTRSLRLLDEEQLLSRNHPEPDMTPEQMRDASLLELFSLEADAQTQVLNEGLLALERNPTQADQLEACMRAAHSLKGAARIVGVDAGVSVSHVMEDCLVSAQEGRLYLQREHIDALLQGTDLLMRIATPGNTVARQDIDGYVAHMNELAGPVCAQCAGGAPEFDVSQLLLMPRQLYPSRALSRWLSPRLSPCRGSRGQQCTRAPQRLTEGGERVLRVTAERLNSLLDLSSKSLVETQRLKPFLVTLQRLKRMQSKACGLWIRSMSTSRSRVSVLKPSRPWPMPGRCWPKSQHLLSEKTAELDEFCWQAGQRAQVLYDTALACRMRPFADVLAGQERMVRDLGRALGKQIRLEIEGEKTQVDRDVLEKTRSALDPFAAQCRRSRYRAPEQRLLAGKPAEGLIRLRISHQAGLLVLELSDDGAGVDLERLRRTIVERQLSTERQWRN